MWTAGDLCVGVGELGGVAHDVDGHTADRREENLDIGTGEEFRVHATGIFEEGTTEGRFFDTETLGHTWEVPHGVDGGLVSVDLYTLVHTGESGEFRGFDDDLSVNREVSFASEDVELFDLDVGFGLGDGRTDVETFGVFLRVSARKASGTQKGGVLTLPQTSCDMAPQGSNDTIFQPFLLFSSPGLPFPNHPG